MHILKRTRSLCPVCLRVIDAHYRADAFGSVNLEKTCPEHGHFCTPAWAAKAGAPTFEGWKKDSRPDRIAVPVTRGQHGCPFDCGLCPDHAQQTCCALIEVTQRCNMHCPVCYAAAGKTGSDPDLTDISDMLGTLKKHGGLANVQLSGGEPTVRDDLPDIVRLTHDKGFPFVQLNTNGLRLAREQGYARELKNAGLDLVYLQWDGLRESTFTALRGGPYLAEKERAAHNCIEAGLAVLLVATVVRGLNDDELGALLDKALALGPQVRGLHLQPAALFGRYPRAEDATNRTTLPELMHALEVQSKGMVRATDFRPPGSEHALCSFSALYQRTNNGLSLVPGEHAPCCGTAPSPARSEAHKARDFVARHWGSPDQRQAASCLSDDFDAFLGRSSLRQRFTLSAMVFQDAHSIDLERLRRCHIHIVTPDRRLIPFCAYNMTSASGVPLYRKD